MANIYTSADKLIGKTPLLELSHLEKKLGLNARILAKLEYFNPAGSVKDRIAKAMIDDAEAAGKLNPVSNEDAFVTGKLIGKKKGFSSGSPPGQRPLPPLNLPNARKTKGRPSWFFCPTPATAICLRPSLPIDRKTVLLFCLICAIMRYQRIGGT